MKLDDRYLKPLPQDEKELGYDLFFREIPPLDPDVVEGIDPSKPLNPQYAITPDRIREMLKPGYLEGETGHCLLPRGGGYAACNVKLHGISYEKYFWWRQWRRQGNEDFQYKLWYPGKHYRFCQRKSWILEDIGMGPSNIFQYARLTLEQLGLSKEELERSPIRNVFSTAGISRSVDADYDESPVSMVLAHFVRDIEDGIELRSRFWIGYRLENDRITLTEPDIPKEFPACMADHCAHEMTNLRNLIPPLWSLYGDK